MHAPKAGHFADESELRDLIAGEPSLLPRFDRGAWAVATEVRVPRVGAVDVVVVDAEGEITIVECKLAANAEIRRWVIGQVFSYAAGLWKLDCAEFERRLAARGTSLTEPFEEDPGWDEVTFRNTVSENLADGAFRLIIAVDQITAELKRTVVFLNDHTVDEVRLLALEVRARDNRVETMVYGENSAEVGPPSIRRPKRRKILLAAIRHGSGDSAADVAERLLVWAESKPQQLKVHYAANSGAIKTPSGTLFRIVGHREVRVTLDTLAGHDEWNDERIQQHVQDLAKTGEWLIGNRPRAPLASLTDSGKDFLALMDRVLETLAG